MTLNFRLKLKWAYESLNGCLREGKNFFHLMEKIDFAIQESQILFFFR